MTEEERRNEIKDYIEQIDKLTCMIIGHVAAIGNDNFNFIVHSHLADILTVIRTIRIEFKQ